MSNYYKWAIPPVSVPLGPPIEVPRAMVEWLLERDRLDQQRAWEMFESGFSSLSDGVGDK